MLSALNVRLDLVDHLGGAFLPVAEMEDGILLMKKPSVIAFTSLEVCCPFVGIAIQSTPHVQFLTLWFVILMSLDPVKTVVKGRALHSVDYNHHNVDVITIASSLSTIHLCSVHPRDGSLIVHCIHHDLACQFSPVL
jgi:hypothetical protein